MNVPTTDGPLINTVMYYSTEQFGANCKMAAMRFLMFNGNSA